MRQRLLSMRSSGIFSFALLICFCSSSGLVAYFPVEKWQEPGPLPVSRPGLQHLNVKDDGGFVASGGALNGGFVPGNGFDGAAPFVTLRVIRFAGHAGGKLGLADRLN